MPPASSSAWRSWRAGQQRAPGAVELAMERCHQAQRGVAEHVLRSPGGGGAAELARRALTRGLIERSSTSAGCSTLELAPQRPGVRLDLQRAAGVGGHDGLGAGGQQGLRLAAAELRGRPRLDQVVDAGRAAADLPILRAPPARAPGRRAAARAAARARPGRGPGGRRRGRPRAAATGPRAARGSCSARISVRSRTLSANARGALGPLGVVAQQVAVVLHRRAAAGGVHDHAVEALEAPRWSQRASARGVLARVQWPARRSSDGRRAPARPSPPLPAAAPRRRSRSRRTRAGRSPGRSRRCRAARPWRPPPRAAAPAPRAGRASRRSSARAGSGSRAAGAGEDRERRELRQPPGVGEQREDRAPQEPLAQRAAASCARPGRGRPRSACRTARPTGRR